jgi:hypothetical protein
VVVVVVKSELASKVMVRSSVRNGTGGLADVEADPSNYGGTMRAAAPVLVVVAVLLALAGCSAEPVTPATSPASTDSCRGSGCSPTYEAPSPTPTAAPSAQVGQTVTNKGITLTVKQARAVDSIEMNESNYRAGSGYEKYTKTLPDAGGRFVMVTAHVVNNAQVSLDLTCSLPINTKLIDAQQRNFDAIQDLYKIKGNPECNAQLQPGFEADMTWVYLVPTSASVIGWGFQDTTDLSSTGDFSTVRFDA